MMLWIGEAAFEELVVIDDAEELCRRLLASRVASRLIAAVEDTGLLDGTGLDELADSFLSHDQVIAYPLAWVSPQWLGSTLMTGTDGPARSTRTRSLTTACPSSRRCAGWAAGRALRSTPARLQELLRAGDLSKPRDRGALIHGLLDAAEVLDEPRRRRLIDRGLNASGASVRRTALDRLCELDGPDKARRRALSDPNATCGSGERPSRSSGRPCSRRDELVPTDDQQG